MWFVLGYAFYASLYAAAGALVPRQEELQSTTTPLTMAILVAFFAGFAVNDDPNGVLAHVCAFIPFTAPITMPGRIALGEVPLVGDRGFGRGHDHRHGADDPVRRPDLRRDRDAHRVGGQAFRSAPARSAVVPSQ